MMKIPIFTYHSAQVDGTDYANNDHIAFQQDLRTICEAGFRVVPLSWVVDWILNARPDADLRRSVALTIDDGCSMDFRDMVHPTWGYQRSFTGIMADLLREVGASTQPTLHATAFVIASPETRRSLGERLAGYEWISDDWWAEAVRSRLLAIENHSWDHNHPASAVVCQRNQERGRFDNIDTYDECHAEVVNASAYIEHIAGLRPKFFAYPWGHASTYMRQTYFPAFAREHECQAAFTAHEGFVTRDADLWAVPRLVFRANWNDQASFRDLLAQAIS